MNTAPWVLVIIDMQCKFWASFEPKTLSSIVVMIRWAKACNMPIVLVEYNRSNHFEPDSATQTVLTKEIGYYARSYTVCKKQDDGAAEIRQVCIDNNLPINRFVLTGVNADYCVLSTAKGLLKRDPLTNCAVIQDACDSDTDDLSKTWFDFGAAGVSVYPTCESFCCNEPWDGNVRPKFQPYFATQYPSNYPASLAGIAKRVVTSSELKFVRCRAIRALSSVQYDDVPITRLVLSNNRIGSVGAGGLTLTFTYFMEDTKAARFRFGTWNDSQHGNKAPLVPARNYPVSISALSNLLQADGFCFTWGRDTQLTFRIGLADAVVDSDPDYVHAILSW